MNVRQVSLILSIALVHLACAGSSSVEETSDQEPHHDDTGASQPHEGSDDGASSNGELELTVARAIERWSLGQAPLGPGETFVEVELAVLNRTSEALTVAPPTFLLEYPNGLQIPGDPVTALHEEGCPPSGTLSTNGELTCVVIFRARAVDATGLVFRTVDTEGIAHEVSAALEVSRCADCGGECTYLDRDPANCGSCGAGVGSGICVDGEPACNPGTVLCEEACVDLLSDPANCGQCGNAVPTNGFCSSGVPSCGPELAVCDSTCVDLQTDPSNCGSCDREIDSSGYCVDGELECPLGLLNCGGDDCVNPVVDQEHCGECHRACPEAMLCGYDSCYNEYSRQPGISCDTLCEERGLVCTGGAIYVDGGEIPAGCEGVSDQKGYCRCEYFF